MKKIKKATKKNYGLPFTPSQWHGGAKRTQVTEITLSYGSHGIGNTHMVEYVPRIESIPPNTIMEYTNMDGEIIIINTAFIAFAKHYTMIERFVMNLGNHSKKEKIYKYRWLVADDNNLSFLNEFDNQTSDYIH